MPFRSPKSEMNRGMPFFRSGDRSKEHSIGLGLTTARRAMEIHGGKIRAFNRPEGGLRVEMVIPFDRVQAL